MQEGIDMDNSNVGPKSSEKEGGVEERCGDKRIGGDIGN